ncbi:MAG: HEAT repeat domain-containing protein [Planctomycetota bacterium]|jgi:HEAT repeat protein
MKKYLISLMIGLLFVALPGCSNNTLPMRRASQRQQSMNADTLRPKATAIVKSGLGHPEALIRTHAIEVAATTQYREMAPLLLKLTKDSSVMVRFAAIVAIGDLECIGYEKYIHPLTNDVNANIQIAAAYALAKLNRPEYLSAIRKHARNDGPDADQTVRANAALLLGKFRDTNDLDLLYEVLKMKDSTDKVRMQAVESIARLGDNEIYRTKLWALQISIYADDRVMGIRGMGALDTSEASNAIMTMLKDDVPEVRLAAANELARLGNPAGTQEVLNYFQGNPNLNSTDMANNMAIPAIGYLNNPALTAYLPSILNSRSEVIRLLGAKSVLLLEK